MEILRFLGLPCLVRKIISAILSLIVMLMPSSMFTTEEASSRFMLTGDEKFSYNAGHEWTVGFSKEILSPEDVSADTYYIAGYNVNNPAQGVLDDMYAKAVYLDDNTGRGGVIICAIDCVGISRRDISDIRQKVIESGKVPDLKSINICATHTHSAVDTQGLWGYDFYADGKNEAFMENLKEKTAKAIIGAYEARTNGKLYFGTNEAVNMQADTRTPIDYDSTVTSIRFESSNGGCDTYIVSFACHAEMLGAKTTVISADFPAYMSKEISENTDGANVVFLNGAIGGLITGDKINEILDKTQDFDCLTYTKEYGKKIGQLVLNIENETELSPIINIKSKAVSIDCDNTALLLARFLGVLNNDIVKASKTEVSILTEVSYLVLGNKQIGVYMIPGELSPELESGNFLSADEAANGTEADYKVLSEMSDCGHNFVLGLCNDEIGYIIPENDFLTHEWLPYFNIPYDEHDRKHYEETNSVGPKTAEILLDAMDELIESAK